MSTSCTYLTRFSRAVANRHASGRGATAAKERVRRARASNAPWRARPRPPSAVPPPPVAQTRLGRPQPIVVRKARIAWPPAGAWAARGSAPPNAASASRAGSRELAAAVGVDSSLRRRALGQRRISPSVASGSPSSSRCFPALLFAPSRSWRRSPRLAVVAGSSRWCALRCVFEPTTRRCSRASLLADCVRARAPRAARPSFRKSLFAATSAIAKLPSRVEARALAAPEARLAHAARERVASCPSSSRSRSCASSSASSRSRTPSSRTASVSRGRRWRASSACPRSGASRSGSFATSSALSLLRPAIRLARASRRSRTRRRGDSRLARSSRETRSCASNVLFLAYNALDARYLWTGVAARRHAHAAVRARGRVLADHRARHAHRASSASCSAARSPTTRARTTRDGSPTPGSAQGLVLALGTYRRIAIHIAHSGLSDLRIVGILGTTLVVCGRGPRRAQASQRRRRSPGSSAASSMRSRRRRPLRGLPTHLVSAEVNVARVRSGEYRPVLHAFRQSHEAESAAALLPLLDHSDARIRQGVAALAPRRARAPPHRDGASQGWRRARPRDVAHARRARRQRRRESTRSAGRRRAKPRRARSSSSSRARRTRMRIERYAVAGWRSTDSSTVRSLSGCTGLTR